MTKPHLIHFPEHTDPTGNLVVADEFHLPFKPERIFWIYNLQYSRGSHAHHTSEQIIIPVSGSFNVDVYHGESLRTAWRLNMPHHGLYLPKLTWRVMKDFGPNSIAMVICSNQYDIEDYIQDFDEFLELVK